MTGTVLDAIWLIALPAVVLVAGGWLMNTISRRRLVREQLAAGAEPGDRKPLNQRLSGYDADDAARHWSPLRRDRAAGRAELLFLKLDLLFPVAYGAAFAVTLLFAWSALGHPFARLWIVLPVAVTVVADWMENAVQLAQLTAYMYAKDPRLDAGWMRVASVATQTKLIFFAVISMLLVVLVVYMLYRAVTPSA